MNASSAKQIIKRIGHQITLGNRISNDEYIDHLKSLGYLEALEGEEVKALIKALEYCATDRSLLAPENNTPEACAYNALNQYRASISKDISKEGKE